MVSRKNDRNNEGTKKVTPYDQGKKDFSGGRLNNPYHHHYNFRRHRDWQLGFNQAYFDNLKKVKQREKVDEIRGRSQGVSGIK